MFVSINDNSRGVHNILSHPAHALRGRYTSKRMRAWRSLQLWLTRHQWRHQCTGNRVLMSSIRCSLWQASTSSCRVQNFSVSSISSQNLFQKAYLTTYWINVKMGSRRCRPNRTKRCRPIFELKHRPTRNLTFVMFARLKQAWRYIACRSTHEWT
jgi:hypothetical protein